MGEELQSLIERAKARMSDTPWPDLRRELAEEGATEDQLEALVEALFPGRPRAHWKAGLVGALAGMALWAVGAWLYNR